MAEQMFSNVPRVSWIEGIAIITKYFFFKLTSFIDLYQQEYKHVSYRFIVKCNNPKGSIFLLGKILMMIYITEFTSNC